MRRSPRRRSVAGLYNAFTPSHRGGAGSPLVLLHGFADTWRTWELVPPALEPAGGWAPGDDAPQRLLDSRPRCAQARAAAPHAAAILATAEGRRRATQYLTTNLEHIPADLLAHQLLGVAACRAPGLIDRARALSWDVDAERITSPVRIVWGTADRLLPWPSAAVRYRMEWLPHADWVEVEGVGHAPQLDVPLETAQLILGHTAA